MRRISTIIALTLTAVLAFALPALASVVNIH
jgi:hypothetical protein